jgi:hypothetical protein
MVQAVSGARAETTPTTPPCAPDEPDCTERLQAAIDSASARKTGALLLEAGEYRIRTLALKSNVRLIGAGRGATVIRALPSAEPGLISITRGPVVHSGLSNLRLVGGSAKAIVNPRQWAFYAAAQAAPEGLPHGGLWWSSFDQLYVEGFGQGFAFFGGESDHLLPHQFNELNEIVVILGENATGPGLLLSGQVSQFSFRQVQLDGRTYVDGASIRIVKPFLSKSGPSLHHFDVLTAQGVAQAAEIDGGQNILFTNCWFENDDGGILVKSGSQAIEIDNCRFANAASKRPAIEFENGTSGSIRGNIFAGERTRRTVAIADGAQVADTGNTLIWGAKN